MSNLKCPFCQQELESVLQLAGAGGLVEEAYLLCSKCNIRGERKLWQELIRTRKALDVAVDAIKNATEYLGNQEPLVDVMAMNLHNWNKRIK